MNVTSEVETRISDTHHLFNICKWLGHQIQEFKNGCPGGFNGAKGFMEKFRDNNVLKYYY